MNLPIDLPAPANRPNTFFISSGAPPLDSGQNSGHGQAIPAKDQTSHSLRDKDKAGSSPQVTGKVGIASPRKSLTNSRNMLFSINNF